MCGAYGPMDNEEGTNKIQRNTGLCGALFTGSFESSPKGAIGDLTGLCARRMADVAGGHGGVVLVVLLGNAEPVKKKEVGSRRSSSCSGDDTCRVV